MIIFCIFMGEILVRALFYSGENNMQVTNILGCFICKALNNKNNDNKARQL